jgi:hypothetical protein
MDDARNTAQVHLVIAPMERIVEIFVQESLVATANSHDFIAARKGRANNRANAGVHAWGIASAGENTDTQCASSQNKTRIADLRRSCGLSQPRRACPS